MDETRRNLIKGMLTGGTLLAFGIPGISQAASTHSTHSNNTGNCQLLLGNTSIGEAFATGARAACTYYGHFTQDGIATFQLKDEVLVNP